MHHLVSRSVVIRAVGLGRYYGPQINLKNDVSSQAVWRNLRGVFGFAPKPPPTGGIHRGVRIAGHALKNINFEVEKGSVVCLDGSSGSGKSVLLRILAGMTPPNEGTAVLYGTVRNLLDAGENLEDSFTALENIEKEWNLHKIVGDSKEYARDVIAFAGIEGFEHILVSKFSTGMSMRLSMALALQGNPDILLLDDVLSVGDIAFQQKCVERLLQLRAEGCTMVLALSDESIVRQLATRVITLEAGSIISDKPPGHTLVGQFGFGSADASWHIAREQVQNDAVLLHAISVVPVTTDQGPALDIEMEYYAKLAPQRCRPVIDLISDRTRVFRSIYPHYLDVPMAGSVRTSVRMPIYMLGQRTYVVATNLVSICEQVVYSLKHNAAVTIEVKRNIALPEKASSLPLIAAVLPWDIEMLQEHT